MNRYEYGGPTPQDFPYKPTNGAKEPALYTPEEDAQIQENGQRMMDAILYLFRFDPWELEELQFRGIVAKIEENIRNRSIYVGA